MGPTVVMTTRVCAIASSEPRAQIGGTNGTSRRADLVAHGGELGQIASRHRPFHLCPRNGRQIFGDQPAGEAARPINDDVELAPASCIPSLIAQCCHTLGAR